MYYFQTVVLGTTQTVAMVSKYSPPNTRILEDSFETLWVFKQQVDGELTVINVKDIVTVISMLPLPGAPDGTWFLCEKPGLDVVHTGGQDEEVREE